MKMSRLVAALAACGLIGAANAQSPLIVSTGAPNGTYSSFFKSIASVCGDQVPLQEKGSSGSDENIENLIAKQADAAFVQSDTLQFVAMNDPRASDSQIRVLLPMYPEEVHVVALKDLSRTVGGVSFWGRNVGGAKVELNSLADLEGVKVGAWGGSYTTARAISYLGNVHYEAIRFDNPAAAKAALDKGEIAAIIAVGGQPLGFVKDLSPNYKLLKIDAALANKVKAYSATRVSYRNINASGIDTVAARSMLVVKNYATPERKARFAALKKCILDNEGTFKEGTGHHPKWSDVDFSAPVSWALYETGASATAPAPAAAKKK